MRGGGEPVSNNPQGGTETERKREEPPTPRTQATTNLVIPSIPSSAPSFANIARARPRPGSVTQSSNVGADGITLDQIVLTDKENFTLSNKGKWRAEFREPLNSTHLILDTNNSYWYLSKDSIIDRGPDDERKDEFIKYGFNKHFYTLINSHYTDIFPTGYYREKDYLTMGFWLKYDLPIAAQSGLLDSEKRYIREYIDHKGVFVTGGEPFNNMTIKGEANYQGLGQVHYYENVYNSNTDLYGNIELLDSSLSVDFGSGIISGKIGELTLNNAKIGNSNGGFFEGNLTGTFNSRSYNGLYGGQFYGNNESDGKPGTVAGTLGGISSDDRFTIMGFWFGDK